MGRKHSISIHTSNTNDNNQIPISLIAKQLFNDLDIIAAFKSLYNKYINANSAPFLINIGSLERKRITMRLDTRYYKQLLRSRNRSLLVGNNSNRSSKQSYTLECNKNCALIDEQYKENNSSTRWLLLNLVTDVDCAAKEISTLLNGTFLRFKVHQIDFLHIR